MRDHYSISQIQMYLSCGLKYFFRYVERKKPESVSAALIFGRAIHATLAAIHEGIIAGHPLHEDEVKRTFRADLTAEFAGENNAVADGEIELRDTGQVLVAAYAQSPVQGVIAAESAFEVPLADPERGVPFTTKPLVGYLDALTRDGFVEFKTAKSAPSDALVERHLQLSAYSYAYAAMYGKEPRATLVTLLKLKKPRVEVSTVTRDRQDIRWFLHAAKQAVRGIEHEIFAPNPGWQCSTCEFRSACLDWPEPKINSRVHALLLKHQHALQEVSP